MNSLMRTFCQGLLGALACPLALAACSGASEGTAAVQVDRSNTLDFQQRAGRTPSLEGRWNALWPQMQIERGAAGLYIGRLVEPNARCGFERGAEVLRGRVDADGVFSGEVLVCATAQCPGVGARWIYFMALVERDASRFVGAIAPTAYEGCNAMFRGLSLVGTREKATPLGAKFSERAAGGASFLSAAQERDCETIAPRGYLQMAAGALAGTEVSVDGLEWGAPPFLRPIAAGNHRVVLKRAGAPPIARTVCVPGGRDPVVLRVDDFSDQDVPQQGERAAAEAGRAEEKACKRSAKKGVLKITLPDTAKTSVAIDGKVQNARGKRVLTRELTAGEHTVILLRTGGAPDVKRTVCIQEGRAPLHVNFAAP